MSHSTSHRHPAEPVETPSVDSDHASADDVASIESRVRAIADEVTSGSRFLQRLAEELCQHFQPGLVAVQASAWAAPVMLVSDEPTAKAVDRGSIRGLLETAHPSPVSCSVRAGDGTARAMRVELTFQPRRTALLLVMPVHAANDVTTGSQLPMLADLKRYATASRQSLNGFVNTRDAKNKHANNDDLIDEPSPTAMTTIPLPNIDEALRHAPLRGFHRSLELEPTAYRIANEAVRWIGCDRATVLIQRSGRLRVKAVSGVAVVNPRSNAVRAAERLAKQAMVLKRPLIFPGRESWPEAIQDPLDEYLDQTGVTTCIAMPLIGPPLSQRSDDPSHADWPGDSPIYGNSLDDRGERLGMLMVEYFGDPEYDAVDSRMRVLADEASVALRNALEHQNVFGLPILRRLGQVRQSHHRFWWLLAGLVAAALLIASMIIRVDHHVIATGTLQPRERRQVFARVDGVVRQLMVDDGDWVEEGTPLIVMENSELDHQWENVRGDIATQSERLRSLRSLRLAQRGDPDEDGRLALQERQLNSELESLRNQRDLLQSQRDQLTVTSPMEGRVVAWDLRRRLSDRPVGRGNVLLAIADESGPWELTLSVPDQNAGPVLEAARHGDPKVRFAVATHPQTTFAATLRSISTAARLDERGRYVLDVTADVAGHDGSGDDGQSTVEPRPEAMRASGADVIGADVTARIVCDRRSLLSSWFSDVIDFAHRNLFFHFR